MLKNMLAHSQSTGTDSRHVGATLNEADKLIKNFESMSCCPEQAAAMFMMPKRMLMRAIYNANNGLMLPGVLARSEGQPPTADPVVDALYDLTGQVYSFFQDIWARNSIDDRGMIIEAIAHYGIMYDNAAWERGRLVCGDGDDILFNHFASDRTVIAHELVHGLTQLEAGIIYSGQTGAINEHISDAFGIAVDHYIDKLVFQNASWVIGSKLLKSTANINGRGIRDIREPGTAFNDPRLGKDPQPAHFKDYVHTNLLDEVHINSGIANRGFYLVCEQLQEASWSTPIKIWYRALCEYANKDTDFQAWANKTCQSAIDLFGASSDEYKAVRRAWNATGIITQV